MSVHAIRCFSVRLKSLVFGFTLYELLLVVAISAILVVMSCVGFQDSWVSFKSQSLRYSLRQSVLAASLSARGSQHAILICGIAAEKRICSSDWSNGWVVTDEETGLEIDRHLLSGVPSLKWAGGLGKSVRFRPDGRPDGVQGGWRCTWRGRELFHEVLLRVV